MKQDEILKQFWDNDRNFADLFNTCVFDGKEVVKAEQLENMNAELSVVYKDQNDAISPVKRTRDLVKRDNFGTSYVILGIENQSQVDYSMPLRVWEYDVYTYRKELNQMLQQSDSRHIQKGQKLNMVVTVVLYYGQQPWDGPRSMRDMLNIPEGLEAFAPSGSMKFVDVSRDKNLFKEKNVRELFELVQKIFSNKKEEVKNYPPVSKEVAYTVAAIVNNPQLAEKLREQPKGEVKMRTMFDEMIEQGIEQGKTESERNIIQAMKKQGFSAEQISRFTEIPLSNVKELYRQIPKEVLKTNPKLSR